MTCIVGLIDDNHVYMGCDSQSTGPFSKTILKTPKIFKNRDFLIGYTDSFRMGQILQYSFVPPQPKNNEDISTYMATDFINEVRSCLQTGGFAINDKGQEEGGNFLVGYQNRLFEIQSDYSVLESSDPYNAVGCGFQYALGAMFASSEKDAGSRILDALQAAEKFNSSVGGPFVIYKL